MAKNGVKGVFIRSLDFGPDPWRVDAFGHLDYPNRMRRGTQPSVCISLSRVMAGLDGFSGSLAPTATDVHHQRQQWLPVGLLPLLRVGDIWQQGKRLYSPDYIVETFENLDIGHDSTTLLKAGVSQDDGMFLLPLAEHPWHRQHTHAYCVSISLTEDRRILIPCWELIRFYFGSSGNVVASLFKPTFRKEMLFSKMEFNLRSRHLHLTLAEKISGASASDIGRIALDGVARQAALRVSTSCLQASVQGGLIYPHTGFPFIGKTTLAASGKWVPYAGREQATFVVFSLRSCSHPFPFRSLRYQSTTQREQDLPTHPDVSSEAASSAFKPMENQTAAVHFRDEDPGRDLTPKPRPLAATAKFPDLENKPIWRSVEVNDEGKGGVVVVRANGAIQCEEAPGEPVSALRIRAVDIELGDNEAVSRAASKLPVFLAEAIREFQKSGAAKVQIIYRGESRSPLFVVPMVVDGDTGEVNLGCLHFHKDGSHRRRKAALIGVLDPMPVRYAVVFEGRAVDEAARIDLFDLGPGQEGLREDELNRHIARFILAERRSASLISFSASRPDLAPVFKSVFAFLDSILAPPQSMEKPCREFRCRR